jgi:hypothetical protein
MLKKISDTGFEHKKVVPPIGHLEFEVRGVIFFTDGTKKVLGLRYCQNVAEGERKAQVDIDEYRKSVKG